jgi:DNA-binding transcriptional ArsR family regulator
VIEAKDELSVVFQALADPTRRAILSHLRGGSATVGELSEPFEMSRPAISQHLKVLERAGLIERIATAQWRTCTLRTEPLDAASEWVDRHRDEWNERFDLLDRRLREMKGTTDAREHRD